MKEKGFTLIELLAIIVILAIIAVITVPIILNIIENSRMGAASDSAYGFKDAVEKYYVSELFDSRNLKLNGFYDVAAGALTGDGMDDVLIPADGTIPTSGFLEYDNSKLKSGCLVIGDYAVSFVDGSVSEVLKGVCSEPIVPVFTLDLTGATVTDRADGYKYIDSTFVNSHPVYFNPTTNQVCNSSTDEDKYVNSNSNTGNANGCMMWYAYSVKGNVVNMILDHNINQGNEGIQWISNSDYSDSSLPESLGVSNNDDGTGRYGTDGNINKGPLTVLKKLKQKTGNGESGANWQTRVLGDYATYSAYLNDSLIYSIDYSSYAARLITSEEFYYISGESFNNTNYWISAPWLTIGLTSDYVLGVKGYWTSSFDSSNSSRAWRMYSNGEVRTYPVYHELFGVRPVITVPVSVIYPN